MELVIGKFILLYLLLPITAVILGAVMVIVARKNQLLSNKKAIFYFLLTCMVLALPGLFGFIDYWFMPYCYTGLSVLYLALGWYNHQILRLVIKEINDKPYYMEFMIVLVTQLVGAALFSLVFNLCNELQYGLWACTCLIPFIFPSLFKRMYTSYMDIPLEIYRIWSYDKEKTTESEHLESDKILVVELELFKRVSDKEPLNIKAKASEEVPFGIWFKLFIDDYNKKSPQSTIIQSDKNNSYGWIFYMNSSVLGRKKYIDPNLSFSENKIKEKKAILAKRTQYEEFGQVEE